jgi:hypothetical protein
MRFQWGGDVIFRNTRLPNKRYVIGAPRTPVATDIREWLSYTGDRILRDWLRAIPGLPEDSSPGAFDRRAWMVWDQVARRIGYNYDKDRQGYDDFWLFPDETLSLGIGDCEDSAILLAALLVAAGISPYCVRVILGTMYDAYGTVLGGHAWTVYQDEGGIWRLLEATLDAAPAGLPEADAFTLPGRHWVYWPDFCFNSAHLWWIRPANDPYAVPPPGLDDYLLRTAMAGVTNVEMRLDRRSAIRETMERVARGSW